jgi:hypothetical protein
LNPTTVGEIVDFVAGKLLDLVGVKHGMETRWEPGKNAAREAGKKEALTPTLSRSGGRGGEKE